MPSSYITKSYEINAFCEIEDASRETICALWKEQHIEFSEFYLKKGQKIRQREEESAAKEVEKQQEEQKELLHEQMEKKNNSKVKPCELSLEEVEFFAREKIIIQEEESWKREVLCTEWLSIADKMKYTFLYCIGEHYRFSLDLHHYAYIRHSLTAEDLRGIKPVDRHLPRKLLVTLQKKKLNKQKEKEMVLERLRGAEQLHVRF